MKIRSFRGAMGTQKQCAVAVAGALALLASHVCMANPTGSQVVNGQVTISQPAPGALSIVNTPGAIINWRGFSIGRGEATRFIQQSPSSAILNRVVGADPSAILGQLTSNGRVFLINPHGIVFGAGSVIDTAGLVASTLNISDADFMAGRYRFVGDSASGAIVNQGVIRTTDKGPVFLIAPNIENNGVIEAPGGSLVLAAGRSVEITSFDLNGIRFALQAPQDSAVNLGRLIADGGAAGMFAGTLRHSGEIRANSVSRDAQGKVVLSAKGNITLAAGSITTADGARGGNIAIGSASGTTLVLGNVSATGTETVGGEVRITGNRVVLAERASIDVSGASGGGTAMIGGDYQGRNPAVQNAAATELGVDSSIRGWRRPRADNGVQPVWRAARHGGHRARQTWLRRHRT